jgi:nicotinate dehydrogenase subunit A
MATFKLNVNGKDAAVTAEESTPLLSVLRGHLHLTGAKAGCGEGECGACTVLIDGHPARSCITSISDAATHSIQTIEGLADGLKLHRVQQAFLEHSAFQCGFCTPGMIMAAVALLNRNPNPTLEDIRTALNGNVCRCGTYPRIVRAIRQAAESAEHA